MFKAVVNMLTWLQKNRLRNSSVDTHFANLTRPNIEDLESAFAIALRQQVVHAIR
jgi:hypothetical protein